MCALHLHIPLIQSLLFHSTVAKEKGFFSYKIIELSVIIFLLASLLASTPYDASQFHIYIEILLSETIHKL